MRVAVVGAAGRMGRVVVEAVAAAADLELGPLVDRAGGSIDGREVVDSIPEDLTSDVVVDFTRPDAVMESLSEYRRHTAHVVIGTSGFDDARIEAARRLWDGSGAVCLIVPNFSIGAVLMMQMAEQAARHFQAAEIIELHHDRKVDAPSGTSLATAAGMTRAAPEQVRFADSDDASRGRDVDGVRVHAVRLPGLLAHQEVMLGNPGELLTIRHDTTDRAAFVPGILLAIRGVAGLAPGVIVGLDALL